jgi:hypothetical protein
VYSKSELTGDRQRPGSLAIKLPFRLPSVRRHRHEMEQSPNLTRPDRTRPTGPPGASTIGPPIQEQSYDRAAGLPCCRHLVHDSHVHPTAGVTQSAIIARSDSPNGLSNGAILPFLFLLPHRRPRQLLPNRSDPLVGCHVQRAARHCERTSFVHNSVQRMSCAIEINVRPRPAACYGT